MRRPTSRLRSFSTTPCETAPVSPPPWPGINDDRHRPATTGFGQVGRVDTPRHEGHGLPTHGDAWMHRCEKRSGAPTPHQCRRQTVAGMRSGRTRRSASNRRLTAGRCRRWSRRGRNDRSRRRFGRRFGKTVAVPSTDQTGRARTSGSPSSAIAFQTAAGVRLRSACGRRREKRLWFRARRPRPWRIRVARRRVRPSEPSSGSSSRSSCRLSKTRKPAVHASQRETQGGVQVEPGLCKSRASSFSICSADWRDPLRAAYSWRVLENGVPFDWIEPS